jgi:ABC-type uncharacterized transport system permease subunit
MISDLFNHPDLALPVALVFGATFSGLWFMLPDILSAAFDLTDYDKD